MGFGGAVSAMITSLKNNNRRKKKNHFSKEKNYAVKKDNIHNYDFPEATPELLEKIKNDLIIYNRKNTITTIIFMAIIIVISIFGFVFISHLMIN